MNHMENQDNQKIKLKNKKTAPKDIPIIWVNI